MRKLLLNQHNRTKELRQLSLFFALLLLPMGVWGQTEYGLTVGGVEVTSANAENIIGDGTVSFNPSTNTLTLDGATISGMTISNGCIVSGLSSLNIVLKGNSTLDCSNDSCTAIRSVANAALTITKGEDECSLGFYGSRAIRDFKSVTLSGMVWDRTCAYQLATINNNGEHTGMVLYDTVSNEIGEINLLDVENLPHPSMYPSYNQQNEPTFGFEGDPSWEIRYSIDYVDESLADVTNALYDMQGDNVPLQGAATVTAWTVFGDATSDEVKGKLFDLSETSLSTVYGTAETLSAPTLRPAIDPEDKITVSYIGREQSDVATINASTGEVTILGPGSETFNVGFSIDDGCTVLNYEDLTFDVTVQNSYSLFIGDTQVTEANADDVLGDGTVSFVESGGQEAAPTYTLTLNGAALTAPVKVGLANLTFDIRGNNTITTNTTCIQNTAATGVPSLTFKSTSDEVGSLILTNTDEDYTGVISESYYGNFTISKELALILYRYGFYTSYTGYFSAGEVHNAQLVPSYGVQVDDLQVYAGNAADVFGDGTVSFDKEKSILTLNGANTGALCSSLAELTVELVGNNTLSEEGSYPVLRSLSGDAVIINVQSTADVMGTLTMNMPYTQAGNFCEDQVTLNIVAPLEVVSGSLTGNDDNNNTVVIGQNFGITITSAGSSYPITNDNRLDVLGDGGSVQFDGKNTLILNNAWISSVILGADDSWVKKGLTIYLKGENTIGEQDMDGLDYYGQGANVPLTFATGDVEPGKLTLSYSDQPLVGFTPTYLNNLTDMMNPDLHQITIAVSMEPFVTQNGEEKTEDGGGVGLGKDIEYAETSILQAGILVNKILYTLPGVDDGYWLEDSKKLVAINSSMTDADANTIMAAVIDGSLLPGTPGFAAAFKGMTFLLPAGNGDIILDVNTNQSGELHVKVGNNDPVVISGTTGFEERRVPYALTEASYVFIYNVTSAPSSSRRSAGHRAPGKKMMNTTTLKKVGVSARSVCSAPEPPVSPKTLTKSDMVAPILYGGQYTNFDMVKVEDTDVASIADDAFEGLTDVTCLDLSATGITGLTIDRDIKPWNYLPYSAFIYLPTGNKVKEGQQNVVIGDVCMNAELLEDNPFEITKDFTAKNIELKRNFKELEGKKCTIMLPFALDETTAAKLGTFYEMVDGGASDGNDGKVHMETVAETIANWPYMFKPADIDFINLDMVKVEAATEAPEYIINGMTFKGCFEKTTIESNGSANYYCFVKDQFVRVIDNSVTVKTFRAYMTADAGAGSFSNTLDIDWGDGTTSIKNMKVGTDNNIYYDLQGRRVLYPQKGVYILNGKKVVIK